MGLRCFLIVPAILTHHALRIIHQGGIFILQFLATLQLGWKRVTTHRSTPAVCLASLLLLATLAAGFAGWSHIHTTFPYPWRHLVLFTLYLGFWCILRIHTPQKSSRWTFIAGSGAGTSATVTSLLTVCAAGACTAPAAAGLGAIPLLTTALPWIPIVGPWLTRSLTLIMIILTLRHLTRLGSPMPFSP